MGRSDINFILLATVFDRFPKTDNLGARRLRSVHLDRLNGSMKWKNSRQTVMPSNHLNP
jgi:hypothetical protein